MLFDNSKIALHQVAHTGAQPAQVRVFFYTGKGGVFKLGERGIGKGVGHIHRPVDAATVLQQFMHTEYLPWQAPLAGSAEEGRYPLAIAGGYRSEGMGEDQGALALPEVTIDLLAVAVLLSAQIEHIVGNLKSETKEKTKTVKAVEALIGRVSNQGTDAERVNEAIPGRLLEHEAHVIVRT